MMTVAKSFEEKALVGNANYKISSYVAYQFVEYVLLHVLPHFSGPSSLELDGMEVFLGDPTASFSRFRNRSPSEKKKKRKKNNGN